MPWTPEKTDELLALARDLKRAAAKAIAYIDDPNTTAREIVCKTREAMAAAETLNKQAGAYAADQEKEDSHS